MLRTFFATFRRELQLCWKVFFWFCWQIWCNFKICCEIVYNILCLNLQFAVNSKFHVVKIVNTLWFAFIHEYATIIKQYLLEICWQNRDSLFKSEYVEIANLQIIDKYWFLSKINRLQLWNFIELQQSCSNFMLQMRGLFI